MAVCGKEISQYPDEGCCLNCSESHEGCLCFDCKCTKCDEYSDGNCLLANELRADNSNLAIRIDRYFISLKFIGPIITDNYNDIRDYIRSHFTWDKNFEEYYRWYDSSFASEFIEMMENYEFFNITDFTEDFS